MMPSFTNQGHKIAWTPRFKSRGRRVGFELIFFFFLYFSTCVCYALFLCSVVKHNSLKSLQGSRATQKFRVKDAQTSDISGIIMSRDTAVHL